MFSSQIYVDSPQFCDHTKISLGANLFLLMETLRVGAVKVENSLQRSELTNQIPSHEDANVRPKHF